MNVYLDYAASAPLVPEALEAMQAALKDLSANPSSIHAAGMEARKAVEQARAQVAGLLAADAREVVFTSGATEANNLALRGVLEPMLERGETPHAVTTALEHASVLKTLRALERRGLRLTVVPPGTDAIVPAADVLAAVRPDTALVSVIAASNELGTRQPVEEIGASLKKKTPKPLLHVDAVQAVVSSEISFRTSQADLLTVSSHKIGGPKGAGACLIRHGLKLAPLLHGGGQESGLRSGTENVPAIAGFGAAAARLARERANDIRLYETLRTRLLGGKIARSLALGASVPHIVPLEMPDQENDWIVLLLSRAGVMVSAGSACKSGAREASEALTAVGLSERRARSVIRASFGPSATERDVDAFLEALTSSASRKA